MAVYTHITEDELKHFLNQYNIGELTAFSGISGGIENTNYILETTSGKYILTLFEQVSGDDLPYFLNLIDHLSQNGLKCPTPIADNDNQIQHILQNKPAAIFSFLNGHNLAETPTTSEHCQLLGATLAQLHKIGDSFPQTKPNPFSLNGWEKFFVECRQEISDFDPELQNFLSTELLHLNQNWPQKTDLPYGTIHADLFPDNALITDGDELLILDFYLACSDFWIYDLAICLNAWCFKHDDAVDNWHFQTDLAHALITGYQSVRPLTHQEKRALPLMLRGAAIRFLLNRLLDQVITPADAMVTLKCPREYVEKLKFHQTHDDQIQALFP